MGKVTLAQVRAHAGRLVASCLAIVIAVAFVVATLVLNDTTRVTVLQAIGAQFVDTDVVIMGSELHEPSENSVSLPDVAAAVAELPGVAAVATDIEGSAEVRLPGRTGKQFISVSSVATDPELQWQQIRDGRLPERLGEVTVSGQIGAEVGDRLDVEVPAPPAPESGDPTTVDQIVPTVVETVTVVGVVDLGSDPTAGISGRFFATGDQVMAWGGVPYQLRIAATSSTDPEALRAEIQATVNELGFNGTAISGQRAAENQAAQFTGDAASLTTILLVFAAIALLVAAMVIANTFSLLLAQRTRELALLRCVGATSRQIRRGVLAEAAITGVLASAIGVSVGIGLAAAVSALAEAETATIPLEGISISATALLVGLGLGTVTTVLAALAPAAAATRVAPLAALRPSDLDPLRSKGGLLRLAMGLVLLLPGLAIMVGGIGSTQPLIAVGGGALSAVGLLLLLQRIIPPAVFIAGRAVARLGGVPAGLAAGNASRNPRRTAATATALLIGVTLTTAMIVGAASTRATTEKELNSSFPTDVIVQSYEGELPASLLDQLLEVDGVSNGTALSATDVTGPGGQLWPALGVDPEGGAQTARSGDRAVPSEGTVFLSDSLAADVFGVAAGEQVTLTREDRSVTLTVQVDPSAAWITMRQSDLATLEPDAGIGQIWLRMFDGRSVEANALTVDEVTDLAAQGSRSVEVSGIVSLRDALNSILNTMLLVVTGLLGVAVVIALIGVGNTLALSVIERRQENGLLRALGLTRGQLRGLLAWEALLVAGVAAVLGVVIGAGYGVAGTAAVFRGAAAVVIDIPWLQVLALVAVATLAGVLASVLPARRAARISPVAAIAG